MHSGQLNPKQLDALIAVVARQVEFLYRLKGRMRERNFPPDDHLLGLTLAAEAAANALHSELLSLRVSIKERSPRARRME